MPRIRDRLAERQQMGSELAGIASAVGVGAGKAIWEPYPGSPQELAFKCEADVIGFGGQAGGGKSDLGIGLALRKHRRSLIMRREACNVRALVDRVQEILVGSGSYNSTTGMLRLPDGVSIEFAGCKDLGDEQKFRGRPHDFLFVDEADQFLELMVRFIGGWVRTTIEGLRCQTVLCFNPPSTAEGRWLIKYFAPWLDDTHPNPASPGELRWFATLPPEKGKESEEVELPTGEPFECRGETVTPKSRTFIPARVQDNPALMKTGYIATLQSLPEPLRSQLLYGDFKAGIADDMWQVVPTEWVRAAQARWTADEGSRIDISSIGVDIAHGGACKTCLSVKRAHYFDRIIKVPGSGTPDGAAAAALVRQAIAPALQSINARRAAWESGMVGRTVSPQQRMAVEAAFVSPPVMVDANGVGASACDFLAKGDPPLPGLIPVMVSNAVPNAKDKSGVLKFCNLRAYAWWSLREALDPVSGAGLALPPDQELLADLCAPRWEMRSGGILIEAKEKIQDRIGRSPDCGDSVVLANLVMPSLKAGVSVYSPKLERKDSWGTWR